MIKNAVYVHLTKCTTMTNVLKLYYVVPVNQGTSSTTTVTHHDNGIYDIIMTLQETNSAQTGFIEGAFEVPLGVDYINFELKANPDNGNYYGCKLKVDLYNAVFDECTAENVVYDTPYIASLEMSTGTYVIKVLVKERANAHSVVQCSGDKSVTVVIDANTDSPSGSWKDLGLSHAVSGVVNTDTLLVTGTKPPRKTRIPVTGHKVNTND